MSSVWVYGQSRTHQFYLFTSFGVPKTLWISPVDEESTSVDNDPFVKSRQNALEGDKVTFFFWVQIILDETKLIIFDTSGPFTKKSERNQVWVVGHWTSNDPTRPSPRRVRDEPNPRPNRLLWRRGHETEVDTPVVWGKRLTVVVHFVSNRLPRTRYRGSDTPTNFRSRPKVSLILRETLVLTSYYPI